MKGTPQGDVIQEMYEQEKKHLDEFNRLLPKYRVRPTALSPFWSVAGFGMGWVTAMIGTEAAMACTVAVEEEIGAHYNDQLREIIEHAPEEEELRKTIREFRDDELEHLETGIKWDAEKAPTYKMLTTFIKMEQKVLFEWLLKYKIKGEKEKKEK